MKVLQIIKNTNYIKIFYFDKQESDNNLLKFTFIILI